MDSSITTAIPFVGRAREQHHMVERFKLAAAGQCSDAPLAGEAGTGTARTAEEFAAVVRALETLSVTDREPHLAELARHFVQAAGSLSRAHDLLDEAGAGTAPIRSHATSMPFGLTPREREVLHLLGRRLSNNEIAAALVLSVRTVERHIANIYAKTGCHSRREARCFAKRHGLIATPDQTTVE
jgi:DNA-binding NarL/FixJ family response regulator